MIQSVDSDILVVRPRRLKALFSAEFESEAEISECPRQLRGQQKMSITVLCRIETVPGRREDFLAEFARVVPLVHQEEGCLEYGPTIDLPTTNSRQSLVGDNVVMIVERWASLAALEAHLDAPHMHEYRPKVKDLVASSTLHILQPAST